MELKDRVKQLEEVIRIVSEAMVVLVALSHV